MRRPGETEDVKKKIHVRARKIFSKKQAIFSGPVAVEGERLEAAAQSSVGRKESRRTSETPPGTWLNGAQKGSLWLCYTGSLAEKWKSEISDKRHRP